MVGEETYVPIYVPLKRNLNNVYYDDGLEDVVKLIRDQKVLLICDGLDEYKDNSNTLIYNILPKIFNNRSDVKTIFTTRLDPDLPYNIDISGNYYVRLLPFTQSQVNEFFSRSKYNLPDVTYQTLNDFGLDEDEISKALLCWMFAVMYNSSGADLNIRNVTQQNTKRAMFFQEVIHSIIAGKHRNTQDGKEKEKELSYKREKKMLRDIAYLFSIYKDNLTTTIVSKHLSLTEDDILRNPIITTYFNLLPATAKIKKIEFFHKSFYEFLLAEAFIEIFVLNNIRKVDTHTPNIETMMFFEGLLDIINAHADSK